MTRTQRLCGWDSCVSPNLISVVQRRLARQRYSPLLIALSFVGFTASLFAQTTLTPGIVAFGSQPDGVASAAQTATFKNTGTIPLAIHSIAITGANGADFIPGGNCPITPSTLGAGQSCSITVAFSPSKAGAEWAVLTVTPSAGGAKSVILTGTGVAPLTLSPATLYLGAIVVGATSAARTVTLTNHTNVAYQLTIQPPAGFAVANNNCGTSIGAGATCTVSVTFSPKALGLTSGTLTFSDGAKNSPQTVSLNGTGTAAVTLSVSNLGFGTQSVGTTSATRTVFLTNHLTSGSLASTVAVSGDFAIASNTCGTVAAGSTCAVGITFTPTQVGSRTGTLTITNNAFGSPETASLTGTGNSFGLTSIAVTPANASIALGNTQQFIATGTFAGTFAGPAHTANLTASVTWSSSATGVATISNSAGNQGLATSVGAGTSTVTARLGTISGSTGLTVTSGRTLTSVTVTPANPSMVVASSQQFAATGTYSDGSTQNLTTSATWSSSNSAVAAVSNTAGTQGVVTADSIGTATIKAVFGGFTGSTLVTVTGGFVLTGTVTDPRENHTATLLNNGMVLIVGGADATGTTATAELYNPATGTFTATGSLNTARVYHTATLLNNGMVLIAGGYNYAAGGDLASAELYDPVAGTFTVATGSLTTAREYHTATLLGNGLVLIAGGYSDSVGFVPTAELYNPATGMFTVATGTLNTPRYAHSATLLNNGTVLIAAGESAIGFEASAELYVPTAETFSPTGSLSMARDGHTATLLNNGTVLIAGGQNPTNAALADAELYNPTAGTFAPTTGDLNNARYYHTATLLNNGTVLIAGGTNGLSIAVAELYDPIAGTFTNTASLNTARSEHTATLLSNGTVLIAGGYTYPTDILASAAELYEPGSLTPPSLVSIAVTPGTSTLASGSAQQFIATGTFSDNSTQQLASVTWSSSNTAVAQVSNDASNSGSAYGVAAGTVTITATAGSVKGSATLNVSAPAASLVLPRQPEQRARMSHSDAGE